MRAANLGRYAESWMSLAERQGDPGRSTLDRSRRATAETDLDQDVHPGDKCRD
jgi:hypothetical protein